MFKYVLFIVSFIVKIISTFNLNNKIIYTYENITNFEKKKKKKKEDFIYLYKDSNIRTKDDVLGIYDEYYISYYCKNDICAYMDYQYSKLFIEIQDKNGNISLYIIYILFKHLKKMNPTPIYFVIIMPVFHIIVLRTRNVYMVNV